MIIGNKYIENETKPTPQQVTITLNIIAVALEPFFAAEGNDEAKDAVDATLNYLMQVTK